MQKGFFKKHGLDIQETAFGGDAKLQQAMAADVSTWVYRLRPGNGV